MHRFKKHIQQVKSWLDPSNSYRHTRWILQSRRSRKKTAGLKRSMCWILDSDLTKALQLPFLDEPLWPLPVICHYGFPFPLNCESTVLISANLQLHCMPETTTTSSWGFFSNSNEHHLYDRKSARKRPNQYSLVGSGPPITVTGYETFEFILTSLDCQPAFCSDQQKRKEGLAPGFRHAK